MAKSNSRKAKARSACRGGTQGMGENLAGSAATRHAGNSTEPRKGSLARSLALGRNSLTADSNERTNERKEKSPENRKTETMNERKKEIMHERMNERKKEKKKERAAWADEGETGP